MMENEKDITNIMEALDSSFKNNLDKLLKD